MGNPNNWRYSSMVTHHASGLGRYPRGSCLLSYIENSTPSWFFSVYCLAHYKQGLRESPPHLPGLPNATRAYVHLPCSTSSMGTYDIPTDLYVVPTLGSLWSKQMLTPRDVPVNSRRLIIPTHPPTSIVTTYLPICSLVTRHSCLWPTIVRSPLACH
jgi:hypothetical protein